MNKVLPPILITLVLAVIAAFSLWAQQAWLVPSVAAAAFLQIFSPDEPSARPYGIAVGQIIGGISGFIGVLALAATVAPAFTGDHHLPAARFGAIVVAVAISSIAQAGLGATSPAGGATAVVVASGVETATWLGAERLLLGITLVTVLGEVARRIVLRIR